MDDSKSDNSNQMQEHRKKTGSPIGKCYEYRESITDKHMTHIKIVKTGQFGVTIDKYYKLHENEWGEPVTDHIGCLRTVIREDYLNNMTEISNEEFAYVVEERLKEIGLRFENDKDRA